jgi:hypothetical protein
MTNWEPLRHGNQEEETGMNHITSFVERHALAIYCALTIVLSFAATLLPLPGEAVPPRWPLRVLARRSLRAGGIEIFLEGFEDVGEAWVIVSRLRCEALSKAYAPAGHTAISMSGQSVRWSGRVSVRYPC